MFELISVIFECNVKSDVRPMWQLCRRRESFLPGGLEGQVGNDDGDHHHHHDNTDDDVVDANFELNSVDSTQDNKNSSHPPRILPESQWWQLDWTGSRFGNKAERRVSESQFAKKLSFKWKENKEEAYKSKFVSHVIW